jgi:hypothetical protein
MNDNIKVLLIILLANLFFVLFINLIVYVNKNIITCEIPATDYWTTEAIICTKYAANTYNSRCERYEKITEYLNNSIQINAWKSCPDGYEKIK